MSTAKYTNQKQGFDVFKIIPLTFAFDLSDSNFEKDI